MNNCISETQLVTLVKLQLVNLYGKNVYVNLKDPKEKRKKFWLYIAYVFVLIVVASYVAGMSYGYIYMGFADILPAYLIMMVSIIILIFSLFKAGDIIFQKNSYDILASFPVKNSTIVISRFVRLYVENILLIMIVMVPAMVVFGIFEKPSWTFYCIGMIVAFFIPIIPITISVFVGALIKAISSKSKHKNLISVLISVALVIMIMIVGVKFSGTAENMDISEIKKILNMISDIINNIYPPAVWLGNAMLTGNFVVCIGCVCVVGIILCVVISVISMNYTWICDGIFSTTARHNYKMENLKTNNILFALYKREFKRYMASSVYVTNTIISPIMGIVFAGAMLFVTPVQLENVAKEFYVQSGVVLNIRNILPMALATVYCMMPITAVSISMEGKQWWIIKTLPIKTKDLLDSKLLMNLSILAPCFVISVIMVAIGQRVTPVEFIWILCVPAIAMMFSSVLGQTINLKFPVFDWENEVAVVKQSVSMLVGGVVPFFVMLLISFGVMMVPMRYINVTMLLVCIVMGAVTVVLYKKNCKVDLVGI